MVCDQLFVGVLCQVCTAGIRPYIKLPNKYVQWSLYKRFLGDVWPHVRPSHITSLLSEVLGEEKNTGDSLGVSSLSS